MGPRAGLTLTLLIGGATLLVAIAIGNAMGNRVLGQATERGPAIMATPVATPVANETNGPATVTWKREQVLSVATDPAFPDPRVTPEPTPSPPPVTPAPRRTYAPIAPLRTPEPTPTPRPHVVHYTSPPLPIPLATKAPTPSATEPATPPSAAPQESPGTQGTVPP